MNQYLQSHIQETLGQEALHQILNSGEVVPLPGGFVIGFWVYGHQCEYYPHTFPPLLRQVETDKEFTSYQQLLEELIDGQPHHPPAV